jgi:hypothetical protein
MVVTWVYCMYGSFLFRRGRHQERLKNYQVACQNGCGSAPSVPPIPLHVKLTNTDWVHYRCFKTLLIDRIFHLYGGWVLHFHLNKGGAGGMGLEGHNSGESAPAAVKARQQR